MNFEIATVDAFTNRPFSGNPAAVMVLPSPQSAEWMQNVAMEMNLAETAFLEKREDGFSLRWFTPSTEVDLCGHATLASAHVLWQSGALPESETARFHTRSGLLTAAKHGEWIELNFPKTEAVPTEAPAGLLAALGISSPRFTGKSTFDYLIEVEEAELLSLHPDFNALKQHEFRGTIVTSASSDPQFEFLSRFFAPAAGINEDPVTGSAHCALAPFWAGRTGKQTMLARQASKRGGILKVTVQGGRVLISGQAITVLNGALTL
ncbi:MAG: PhzF family phenazine biosynthesis protein [Acidobacteriota bacterium]|nr:PhzF family phenazine biosynthesis protein [Acidobacteriota bacterium]